MHKRSLHKLIVTGLLLTTPTISTLSKAESLKTNLPKQDDPEVGALQLCDAAEKAAAKDVEACKGLVDKQKQLLAAQDDLIVKVTKQRNEALELTKDVNSVPWYVYVLTGAAGALILDKVRR